MCPPLIVGNQIEGFERQEIADLIGMPYALVKNWSSGRPLLILPSIHDPGQRGKQPLYNREDVYRFGLARVLSTRGLSYFAVDSVLTRLDREWLQPGAGGLLSISGLHTGKPRLLHFPRSVPSQKANHKIGIAMMKMGGPIGLDVWHTVDLSRILDWLDLRIVALRENRLKVKQRKRKKTQKET